MTTVTCLSHDAILKRYPRLIRCLAIGCCLSVGEALSCIQCHQLGDVYGGEAVAHGGGVVASLRHAISVRAMAGKAVK
jgi:hypothetical protein